MSADQTFIPRTEREYWVAIADALNTAEAVGMPVGIDLDGTLTDHNTWSVIWDRTAERWEVAVYDDDIDAPLSKGPDPSADNARLRLALASAKRGRSDARAEFYGEQAQHRTTVEQRNAHVRELKTLRAALSAIRTAAQADDMTRVRAIVADHYAEQRGATDPATVSIPGFLGALSGGDLPADAVKEERCLKQPIGCGKPLIAADGSARVFWDENEAATYEAEWRITGLCPDCQDALEAGAPRG